MSVQIVASGTTSESVQHSARLVSAEAFACKRGLERGSMQRAGKYAEGMVRCALHGFELV